MNNIKIARRKAGYTQAAAARAIGISQTGFSAWERDAVKIADADYNAMADLFGVSVGYLKNKDIDKKPAVESADFLDVSDLTIEERKLVKAYISGILSSRHTP